MLVLAGGVVEAGDPALPRTLTRKPRPGRSPPSDFPVSSSRRTRSRFSFSRADFGVESEQYAGNIGMVRRVNNTIGGPATYDLVFARVGTLVIEAMPHVSLSLSLGDTSPAEVNMVLRVQTNSPITQTIRLPTGQELDAVVRDEHGRVVWKWFDGRVVGSEKPPGAGNVHRTSLADYRESHPLVCRNRRGHYGRPQVSRTPDGGRPPGRQAGESACPPTPPVTLALSTPPLPSPLVFRG
jgi:hypothetical protein